MKTQIIQLAAHDDALSTRDKMSWGKTGRILLLWPRQGQILTRRLDLLLLQRHSATLGAQLALVTDDAEVRFHARQLGIPVFKNAREAQTARWRAVRRRRTVWRRGDTEPGYVDAATLRASSPRPPVTMSPLHPLLRLGLFTLSVVALLSMAATLLPGAQITLTPATQIQEITLPVSASASISAINLAGELPAHGETIIVEGRDSITATGSTLVPEHPATGQAQFTNLTGQPVSIPAGLIVATAGPDFIRFAVTRSGQVAAGAGKTTTLPVSAVVPGSSGNLPASSLQAIEGPLGLSLTVTNRSPTQNGSDRAASAPTDNNRIILFNQLVAALRRAALAEIQSGLVPGDVLLSNRPNYAILEKTFDPASNQQPATQLHLTLRLEFQALVVSGDDVRSLATTLLDLRLPDGFAPLAETLEVETATQPTLDEDATARWRITARRTVQARLVPAQAVNLALGLSPLQASQRLAAALPLAAPPQVELTPAWWPRLPFVPFRITVFSIQ